MADGRTDGRDRKLSSVIERFHFRFDRTTTNFGLLQAYTLSFSHSYHQKYPFGLIDVTDTGLVLLFNIQLCTALYVLDFFCVLTYLRNYGIKPYITMRLRKHTRCVTYTVLIIFI